MMKRLNIILLVLSTLVAAVGCDKTEEEAKELVKEAGGGDATGGLFDL